MTTKRLILIFAIAVTSMVWGCKSGGGAASTNASSSTIANKNQTPAVADKNTNSSSSSAASQPPEQTKPSEPAQLIGTYEAREIQEKGVVTLMSKIKTLISFAADGTFSRASLAEGKTYHTDSGLFRIEPP